MGTLMRPMSLWRHSNKKDHQNLGILGTSLMEQWLRLPTPNAEGPGLIPGQGTRSHMHAATKSSHATNKEPVSHN